MTRAELEQKQGKEITDAIIHYKTSCKKIYEAEVRDHPDAPGCEALGKYIQYCSSACNLILVFHDPVGRWPGSTGFWIRKRRRSGRRTGSASCSAWTTWKIPWPALARRRAKPQRPRRQPRRPRRRWGQGIIINNTSLNELRMPGRSFEDCRCQHRQPQR